MAGPRGGYSITPLSDTDGVWLWPSPARCAPRARGAFGNYAGFQTPRCVLAEGNVLNPTDMPDEILSRADVVFWNNYGGHWEQDTSIADDGRPVRLQDQVRDKLLRSMHEGALRVAALPWRSRACLTFNFSVVPPPRRQVRSS